MVKEKHSVSVSFIRQYSQEDHTCQACGAAFVGPRLRVYCTETCRKRAAWQRIRSEINDKRRIRRRGMEKTL